MSEREETDADSVTVSLPHGMKQVLEGRVAAGEAPSVAALVASALDDRFAPESTTAWIMERRGGRPIPEGALAYWRELWSQDAQGPAGQISA
jgi:hypothetical protein